MDIQEIDSLDIAQLERSAAARLEIAQRAKELQNLISATLPGYGLFIERRNRAVAHTSEADVMAADFTSLSGVKQIEAVLRENRVPMQKMSLLAMLHDRGSKMNLDTLTSYLSRYPQFVNRGHGIWGLPEKNYSNGTEVNLEDIL